MLQEKQVFRRAWSTYVSVPAEEAETIVLELLKSLKFKFESGVIKGNSISLFMLGSYQRPVLIRVIAPVHFEIKIFSASGDPPFRAFQSFLGTSHELLEKSKRVCVISLTPVSQETRSEIEKVIRGFARKTRIPPWDLSEHPRFRLAFILKARIRKQWSFWLDIN